MFIELHIIQNFAPSNLNRDDTDNPKDCEFGGVRRARISSQCIKRAIRLEPVFSTTTQVATSERTRWLASEITKKLVEKGKPEEDTEKNVIIFIKTLLGNMGIKDKLQQTKVIFYISEEEKNNIADSLIEIWDNVNEKSCQGLVKQYTNDFKDRTSAPDIAMFGRMLAKRPKLSLDAACQVAHAISTHRVNMDFDFFTAVDDLLPEDQSGAAMEGVTGFNSACFYRYACIDWNQLLDNLGKNFDLAARTVEGFLRASALAIPTGKQNSFAAQNPPSFLMAVIRKDGTCWSLANAFEKPIHVDHSAGLVEKSIAALDDYWGKLIQIYGGGQSVSVVSICDTDGLNNLRDAKVENLEKWLGEVLEEIPEE